MQINTCRNLIFSCLSGRVATSSLPPLPHPSKCLWGGRAVSVEPNRSLQGTEEPTWALWTGDRGLFQERHNMYKRTHHQHTHMLFFTTVPKPQIQLYSLDFADGTRYMGMVGCHVVWDVWTSIHWLFSGVFAECFENWLGWCPDSTQCPRFALSLSLFGWEKACLKKHCNH